VPSSLQIGPLRWELELPADLKVSWSDPAYDGFRSNSACPLVTIPVSVCRETKELPAGEPLYRGGKNWALWEAGRDLIICSGFTGQPAPRFYCRIDRDSGAVRLSLDPAREDGTNPLRYPIDQILSWGPLAQCGGLILHSAVAVKDGIGWVFSGRSGAGKSTLSEQCHQAGWRILNDDRVMVFKRDDSWMVAGTPWHGSGRFAEAEEVPLGGVLFIEKSERDQAIRMKQEQVRYSLLDVAAIPWFEDRWAQAALDAADRFSKEVSFYRFECTKDRSAVDVVEACNQEELAAR
jgi:hypothetical protein